MIIPRVALAVFLSTILVQNSAGAEYEAENFFLVIIDGARYTETFGDPDYIYIPQMYGLSLGGTVVDSFYNDSLTYTSRAIPAIWCGAWTDVRDTVDGSGIPTQYCVLPTFFEYYRKQQIEPADEVWYFLKSVYGLWQFSYHQDYGPPYWASVQSSGYLDREVFEHCQTVMELFHPSMVLLYLANVDHAGHTGDWSYYTSCITIADSIVTELWELIESDPHYAGRTDMIVTNDHGRHDDDHGGFQHHGCGCEGCRHIMFLGMGPDFRQGHVSYEYGRIPDIVPTIGEIMGFDPEYSTGEPVYDALVSVKESATMNPGKVLTLRAWPSIFSETLCLNVQGLSGFGEVAVYDALGRKVRVLDAGNDLRNWDGRDVRGEPIPSGVYILRCEEEGRSSSCRVLKLAD
jgi:hypothetical protein